MSTLEYQSLMWPKRVPNDKLMHEIRQIAFYVHDDLPGVPSHLIAIYSTNIYQRPTPHPSEWRRLPAIYKKHISRLISRNVIFINVHDHLAAGRRHQDANREKVIRHLRSYIAYNDRVLDRVWGEARRAALDDRMTWDWRSEALDRWLVLDVIVSDHSIDALRTFHKYNPESMLDADPMEFDWDDFYNTTPAWYNGGVTSLFTLTVDARALLMNNVIGWLSASLKVKDTDAAEVTTRVGDDVTNEPAPAPVTNESVLDVPEKSEGKNASVEVVHSRGHKRRRSTSDDGETHKRVWSCDRSIKRRNSGPL